MSRKTGKTAVASACIEPSGPALAGDGVERALENVSGCHLVDDLAAALAGQVGLADEEALDGGGREALVPERDRLGEAGLLDEVAGELAHRLAARPLAAVHVHRQADDQPADPVVPAERREACGVVAELG